MMYGMVYEEKQDMKTRVNAVLFRAVVVITCLCILWSPVSAVQIMVFEQTDKTAPINQALIYANGDYVAATDLNGTYNLSYEGDPPALRIAKAGYRDWTGSPQINDTLVLAPMQSRNTTYTLHVFDADTLLPVQGAMVRVNEELEEGRTQTDVNGTATLSLRSEQVYDLVITSQNYQTFRDKLVTGFEDGQKQYSMIKKDRLSLFVKDGVDSQPVSGAELLADGVLIGRTNEKGILITNLSRGQDHTIDVHADGYARTTTLISPKEDDLIIDLTLSRQQSDVFVSVYDSEKRPVEGVHVSLDDADVGVTNEYGRVLVPDLDLKTYDLVVSKEGYNTVSQNREITSDTTDVIFEITPALFNLDVHVTTPEGLPIVNASVSVDNTSTKETSSEGNVTFLLAPGSYQVFAEQESLSNNTTVVLSSQTAITLLLTPDEQHDDMAIPWVYLGGGLVALILVLLLIFLRGGGGNRNTYARKKRSSLRRRSL
jgi:hypothetical protein